MRLTGAGGRGGCDRSDMSQRRKRLKSGDPPSLPRRCGATQKPLATAHELSGRYAARAGCKCGGGWNEEQSCRSRRPASALLPVRAPTTCERRTRNLKIAPRIRLRTSYGLDLQNGIASTGWPDSLAVRMCHERLLSCYWKRSLHTQHSGLSHLIPGTTYVGTVELSERLNARSPETPLRSRSRVGSDCNACGPATCRPWESRSARGLRSYIRRR